MFWRGIAYRTQTGLHSFQERINAQIHSDFLRDEVFPEVKELMPTTLFLWTIMLLLIELLVSKI